MIRRLSLLLGALLLVGFTEPTKTNSLDPAEAAKQGRDLATEILAQKPGQNYTNRGTLRITDATKKRTELSLRFQISVSSNSWETSYEAEPNLPNPWLFKLTVIRSLTNSTRYEISGFNGVSTMCCVTPHGNETMTSFAGSDFWLADFGLEFFQWSDQKILKSELRKTLLCRVLESINPQPATNAYSRVVSWIDTESLGLVHADAYDAAGKLLKEFDPKTVKEVDGQPQLVKMEMYNRQTRSRSQIEFNFDSK